MGLIAEAIAERSVVEDRSLSWRTQGIRVCTIYGVYSLIPGVQDDM